MWPFKKYNPYVDGIFTEKMIKAMIKDYKRKANIAAGIYLVTAAIIVTMIISGQVTENIWKGNNYLMQILFVLNGICLVVGPYNYFKYKGLE